MDINGRKEEITALSKIKSSFIAEDAKTVKGYILTEVVIPGIKRGILGAIEMMLYGKTSNFSGYSSAYRSSINSNVTRLSYWKGTNSTDLKAQSYTQSRDFENIIVSSRGEAEQVIDYINDVMDKYHKVHIADLYEAVNVPVESVDYKYGWTSMRGFDIVPRREGYLIKTPRPMQID